MPSTSLITSSRSSCTFHHSCCGSVLLSRTDHLLENPTMDHPLMHRRRAPSSSVFSFEAAAAAVKVVKEEEDYSYSTEEEGEEEDDEGGELEAEESYPKTKRMNLGGGSGKKGSSTAGGGGGGGVTAVAPLPPGCQVDKCEADLTGCKRYHQRHKVCEYHAKAQVVIVAGLRQRFCQQCSRFHGLSEFDDAKRSCRRRLAGHNERRRKHFSESHGEGAAAGRRESAARIKKNQCRQAGESGRTPMGFV